jgi:hypothetical protein
MPQAQFRVIAQFVFVKSPKSGIKIEGLAIVMRGPTGAVVDSSRFSCLFFLSVGHLVLIAVFYHTAGVPAKRFLIALKTTFLQK